MEQGDILIDHGLHHLWMSIFGFMLRMLTYGIHNKY